LPECSDEWGRVEIPPTVLAAAYDAIGEQRDILFPL